MNLADIIDAEIAHKVGVLIADGPLEGEPKRAITALLSVAYATGALSPLPLQSMLEAASAVLRMGLEAGADLRKKTLAGLGQQDPASPPADSPLEALVREFEKRKQ